MKYILMSKDYGLVKTQITEPISSTLGIGPQIFMVCIPSIGKNVVGANFH